MTEKEIIREEIRRRRKENFDHSQQAKALEDDDILYFIDNMPTEEEKKQSRWLKELQDKLDNATDEEIKKWWEKYFKDREEKKPLWKRVFSWIRRDAV